MDEVLKEVYHMFYDSQQKYVYFIEGVDIAAIGFAITRSENLKLNNTQILLGIGVLCWGLSFLFGCWNREYFVYTLYSNIELIRIQDGMDLNVQNPIDIKNASDEITDAANKNSDKMNVLLQWEVRLFILGVLFDISWHIYQMYLNK